LAVDKEITVKVSIDPFQEVDKKKWKKIEADVKAFKKPGRVDISGKFSPTTAKWDKRKLEAQARAIFRYDLSLYASQIWQAFAPIEKAKNEQDKKKASAAFIKAMPKLQKAMVRNLNEKFAEFQEDIASGSGDDQAELKRTRKLLSGDSAYEIAVYADELREMFVDVITDDLRPLKVQETKTSGEDKAKATKELDKELKKALSNLDQKIVAVTKGFSKLMDRLLSIPSLMVKSQKKDMSDAVKLEYSKAAADLAKSIKPIEKHIAAAAKNNKAVMGKIARKDFSKSTVDLAAAALYKIIDTTGNLSDAMGKIDAKLKKLEQAVKKR